jgi:hypothetical protein
MDGACHHRRWREEVRSVEERSRRTVMSINRAQLRFLRVLCPSNHVLIEVVPGLDGPVLLLKGAITDKARPAVKLAAVVAYGPNATVLCQCACATHEVLASWIMANLTAGVVRVEWS